MSVLRQSLRRAQDGSLQFVRTYSAPASRSVPENKQKYIPSEGTYPKGFLAGTAHAGVKISNTKYDDVTMIASEQPCNAAAVFTRNAFKAAPVQLSKTILAGAGRAHVRGVIVNSGCANAVTGDTGSKDARSMAVRTDECFSGAEPVTKPSTLVMSTGVIGQKLPIDRILNAIPKAHAALGNTHQHWLNAANAICTTDTFPKLISRTFTLPSQPQTTYSIAGITKGAGMIHPNMATLLGIVCTDAAVDAAWLQTQLKTAVDASFNRISIDGDTSTNDSVVLLANGAASSGHVLSEPHDGPSRADAAAFESVLSAFMVDLAQLVVRDGEGATKFVTIRVLGSDTLASAILERVAMSIARSPLVKTALYGKDANWGRILCAIGYSPDALDATAEEGSADRVIVLQHTSVSFVPTDGSPELMLLRRGEPEEVDEARAQEILDMDELEILVDLDDADSSRAASKKSCRVWTCDFSHEYVTINGDYRT